MPDVASFPYRLAWDKARMSWVLWHGRWEMGAIHAYLPGRPQMHRPAAREWAEELVGPLDWQVNDTARPR